MQNRLVDYVDGKSQTPESFEDFQQCSEMSPFFYPLSGHYSWFTLFFTEHFPLEANITLGQLRLMVTNVRACVDHPHSTYSSKNSLADSHTCPRAPDAQRGKSLISSHMKTTIFILEIVSCNLLPFPAERHFKIGKYKEQTKFREVSVSPFLGPRKIVFITTYIEYKRLE